MADLGVSHLPLRQPDGTARSLQRRMRVRRKQMVEVRLPRCIDGRNGRILGNAVAVENEQEVLAWHGGRLNGER